MVNRYMTGHYAGCCVAHALSQWC